jgi:predicted AlkP superfamily phosphohydrolase/phosphomutase
VEQVADVCYLALQLEADLALLCVDFMSSDVAGHLTWHRLDATHPSHTAEAAGDELVRVYEAVDSACAQLIEQAEWLWGERPTTIVLSDHGMKPTHWLFRVNDWLAEAGFLQYRRSTLGSADTGEPSPTEQPAADVISDIELPASRAYCFGYGGLVYVVSSTRGRAERRVTEELADALGAVAHPETGEPAFDVRRKEEVFRGALVDKAPELVLVPRDERVFVDASRRDAAETFERNDHVHMTGGASFSGQHAATGILAAAGPGIALADVPAGTDITQLPATLLALHGLSADLDGPPIHAVIDADAVAEAIHVQATRGAIRASSYSSEEEARLVQQLRELGYE